jgi:hypothetical protein
VFMAILYGITGYSLLLLLVNSCLTNRRDGFGSLLGLPYPFQAVGLVVQLGASVSNANN